MNNILLYIIIIILTFSSCIENTNTQPLKTTMGTVEINGSHVYYKIIGEGRPLIIVHGGPVLDHSYMLPWFKALAKDHQLIFYDQRACGKSSLEVDTTTMSLRGFTDDIELLRIALNLDRVSVLGHSWGGLIAMHYAIRYPDFLESLILSNSIPPDVEEWQKEQKIIAKRFTEEDEMERSAIINSPDMKNNPGESIKKLLLLSFKTQFYQENFLDSLSLFIPEDYMARSNAFQRLGTDLVSFDLYEDLKKIKAPTFIIYGDDEPAASSSGINMASVIPNAELKIISECGHFPFIERPNDYFTSIEKFIAQ